MVTKTEDVLNNLGIAPLSNQVSLTLDLLPEEQTIINILSTQSEGLSINELTNLIQLDTAKVSSTLTMMEIKGMVKQAGIGKFTCLIN